MGVAFTPAHAARLAAQLPRTSRSLRAAMTPGQREASAWSDEMCLLARVSNDVRWLAWSKSKAARLSPDSPPAPLLPPWARDPNGTKESFALPEDEYEELMRGFEARGEAVEHG